MSQQSLVKYFLVPSIILCICLAEKLPIRINLTDSMPQGIYLLKRTKEINRNDFVMVCLSNPLANFALQRGYLRAGACENGEQPLLKQVVGIPNDIVNISASFIMINDRILPHSTSLNMDKHKRLISSIPHGTYILKANQLWLYGTESARSWDSRYFGIVNFSQIIGIAKPLLTWS